MPGKNADTKTDKKNPYLGPLYSSGTPDQDSKENVGNVEGPLGGKSIPDGVPNYAGYPKGKG